MMKIIHGIYFPSTDKHFDKMVSAGAEAVAGKGTYQLKKYRAALAHVKSRLLALDIGGHVGLWSRVMSYDFKHVIAFEPIAAHRECFVLNLNDRNNVELYPLALGDRAEKLSIYVPPDNTGHSHVARIDTQMNTEVVDVRTLDSFDIPAEPKIGFMKIDVEGYELAVLIGAERTIKTHRPVIIIEQKPNGNAERYHWGQHDAVKLLKDWGYREAQVISGDHIMVPL
jgi:FkbM family methyltransferase